MNCFIIFSALLACLFMPSSGHGDTVSDIFDIKKFSRVVDGSNIVTLPVGLYQISETIVLPSNTIFEGAGSSTVLKVSTPFSGSRFITNSNAGNGSENITLRSFKVVFDLPILKGDLPGVMRFENVRNLRIQDITMFLDTKLYGIDLSANIKNSAIENNIIKNIGLGGAIMVRNREAGADKESCDSTIRGNNLSSFSDEPLAVFGWMGLVRQVTVDKNTINANGASFGITIYGIDSPKHKGKISDVVVRENSITGGKHGSIGIKGGAEKVRVSNNRITNSLSDGIFIHSGGEHVPPPHNVTVIDNDISDVGRHGILATGSNLLIENNRIDKAKGSGIYVSGNNQVLRNKISNARPGILADGNLQIVIRGNTLTGGNILNLNKANTVIENNKIIH